MTEDWYYLLPEDHDKLGTILEDLDAIDCLLAEEQKIDLSEER